VIRRRLDANGGTAHAEVDRLHAWCLGEAEEGIGHEVLRIAWSEIAGKCAEEFELPLGSAPARSVGAAMGIARRDGHVPLGGEDRAYAWIGGRFLGAEIDPGLQIIERIDDAPTDLPVLRPGAVGAVLFEGSS
jgi:hypothetical protein